MAEKSHGIIRPVFPVHSEYLGVQKPSGSIMDFHDEPLFSVSDTDKGSDLSVIDFPEK